MTIANLLGVYGVDAVVIDREPAIIDYPRAVGIDDESLRTCQTIGLVDDVLADTLQNMPIRYYTSWGRCFAHVQPSARPFGWARRNLFLQPLLERTLRAGVARFDTIDVRLRARAAHARSGRRRWRRRCAGNRARPSPGSSTRSTPASSSAPTAVAAPCAT